MAVSDSRFCSTVPRELVHRAAVSEVYLTGLQRVGPDRFEVYAQWPRLHYFYNMEGGEVEAAMIIETFRQATVYIAHQGYDVDLESCFLLPELHLTRLDPSCQDPLQPADVTLSCSATEVKTSAGALAFMKVSTEVSVGGIAIARIQAGARIVTEAAYARYRGQRVATNQTLPRLTGVPRQLIGRTSDTSVLLGASSGHRQWQLNVDLSDPVFFDHYVDHVPGVALLEVARQTIAVATHVPRIDFYSVSATFHAMVELNSSVQVSARDVASSDSNYECWNVKITTGDVVNTTIIAFCKRRELTTAPLQSTESSQQNQTMSFDDAHS